MKRMFKITFGNGTAWTVIRFIEVDDFQCEQDALDIMIDQCERNGEEGFFLTHAEIDSGDFPADEYVIGGNHGRHLHHRGIFSIEEVSRTSDINLCAVREEESQLCE